MQGDKSRTGGIHSHLPQIEAKTDPIFLKEAQIRRGRRGGGVVGRKGGEGRGGTPAAEREAGGGRTAPGWSEASDSNPRPRVLPVWF
ncbi:hypothetical protein E2C01_037000 [Portunus trituberculatus]|uniref:Uncharacterized protein n=1 Tax=Portunus trituberculatus TaxID=210409 RepID=A0A5B7FCY3_PORTR|nr:hypothetical protein [Portunus trituberculatus]